MDTKSKVEKVLLSVLGEEFKGLPVINREHIPTWDSLKHLDIIFALEEEFGVMIEPEDFSKLDSADTISTYLESNHGA